MLNHITIKNFAVVDTLNLELTSGLSVLTGETGAGKSILIDALGLILGDRADASNIRYGSQQADIVAEFDLNDPLVKQWLHDHDLDSDDECLIRRTISGSKNSNKGGIKGRSRGFINGHPIPLQLLKELGEKLVNIHGQNTHQALLKSHEQGLLLDNFAGINTLRKEVNHYYKQWKKKSSDYLSLKQATIERHAKLDLLHFQVQELNDFGLQKNELPLLEQEHQKLSNASRLINSSQNIHFQLGQDEEKSITHQLNQCLNELHELSQLDKYLIPIIEMLNNASIQIDESSSELRHYIDSLELDPERLHCLDNRISSLYDLARKHRVETNELFNHSNILKKELEHLENADSHLESLLDEIKTLKKHYFKCAKKLTSQRITSAKLLAQQVLTHIHELGMEHCIFDIKLFTHEEKQPQPDGMEKIEFYVSTNPGHPLQALNKVVSGGELSRISLAIQVVTAQFSQVPTLIFDEIDVGIGGGIAERVGSKLRLLGKNSQILCVTHQAQVASQAHQHFNVYKKINKNKTITSISLLNEEQQIEELSRMMGGIEITEQTRSHAREMRKKVLNSI